MRSDIRYVSYSLVGLAAVYSARPRQVIKACSSLGSRVRMIHPRRAMRGYVRWVVLGSRVSHGGPGRTDIASASQEVKTNLVVRAGVDSRQQAVSEGKRIYCRAMRGPRIDTIRNMSKRSRRAIL
jgi:hypothetical protein